MEWTCPNCGRTGLTGNFCGTCATPRSESKTVVYDWEKQSQEVTTGSKKSYSKAYHIEYDEEAYNAILRTLNSVGDSYNGKIKSACSNIESAINSFPDSYSCNIGDIGSSIEEHISLINLLSEMTNYSLLAYQTCDDILKDGLYLLIDSLFDDSDRILANRFKNIIKSSVEDRDGDKILEYKENVNFQILSANAIVSSVEVDEYGNKWYLSKNNTVIGVDGQNIEINYGGYTFSLSCDENGIITLKDNNGNDLNIFGDYNNNSSQYGGNQVDLKWSYDDKYVNEIISRYFPNSTIEERTALLDSAANHGCGYIAITNFIFKQFEGNEREFYNTFGYPMYELKKQAMVLL